MFPSQQDQSTLSEMSEIVLINVKYSSLLTKAKLIEAPILQIWINATRHCILKHLEDITIKFLLIHV